MYLTPCHHAWPVQCRLNLWHALCLVSPTLCTIVVLMLSLVPTTPCAYAFYCHMIACWLSRSSIASALTNGAVVILCPDGWIKNYMCPDRWITPVHMFYMLWLILAVVGVMALLLNRPASKGVLSLVCMFSCWLYLFICSFLECTVRTHCTPSSSNKSIHIPMTRGGRGAHLYVSHDMLSGSMDLTDDIDGLSPSLKYRFYRHVPEAEGDAYSQDASVLAICIPLGVIASSIPAAELQRLLHIHEFVAHPRASK